MSAETAYCRYEDTQLFDRVGRRDADDGVDHPHAVPAVNDEYI